MATNVIAFLLLSTVAALPVPSQSSGLCERFYLGTPHERQELAATILNEARSLAGLPLLTSASLQGGNFWDFFWINHGVHTCDNHFSYQTVWKGANNFFQENLKAKCNDTGYTIQPQPADVFTFTYVRDPFSHFVSGYREAGLRTADTCCGTDAGASTSDKDPYLCRFDCNALASGDEKVAAELAKAYIHELLDVRLLNNRNFLHISLQSANIFSSPRWPDFIGALETIETDWNRMCEAHECPEGLRDYKHDLNTKLGEHAGSSSDRYNHGAGLIRALAEEPQLMKAVRKLLSLDEDCLHEVLKAPSKSRHKQQRQLSGERLPDGMLADSVVEHPLQ